MARRVLFILLSFVVFGSAMSSGYSYFMTRQAANDYQQSQIEKLRVGAIVEEANQQAKRAKDSRIIAEEALKKLTRDYQTTKKSEVTFKKKVAALEVSVKELEGLKNKAEEDLRSALEKSKTAKEVKNSSAGAIKALEKKLVSEKANRKKLQASIKKAKKDAADEREAKKAAMKARAEAEKNLKSSSKELKAANEKLKSTVAQLSDAKSKNKKIEENLALLKKEKASDEKDKKETATKDNGKEVTKLRAEFNKTVEKLNAAEKKLIALQEARDAESKKVEELKKGFEASRAELLKKIATAEKETAELKAVAAKAVEAGKKAEETGKVSAGSDSKDNKEKQVAAADSKKSSQDSSKKKNDSSAQASDEAGKKDEDNEAEDKEKERQERAKLVQKELKRLGCYDGEVDGVWGRGSLAALVSFSESANLDRVRKYPTKRTIAILKGKTGTVCKVAGAANKDKPTVKAKKTTTAEPPLQTLREQCLASCIGAFESVKSCRENC